jgi:anti-sigma factor RsiW
MKKIVHCKDVFENLSCYIDGDGSVELREALERHIAHCRRCSVVADTTKRTLRIVVDVKPFEVPLGVSARLYARLEKILSEDFPVQ